jgi:hypothetical protein
MPSARNSSAGPIAGEHQQLGRVDGAARKHDLGPGFEAHRRAVDRDLHRDGAPALDDHPCRLRAGQHGEVGTVHHGVEIMRGHVAPPPVLDRLIGQRDAALALHHRGVVILMRRDADAVARGDHGRRDGRGVLRDLGMHDAALAAIGRIGGAVEILHPLEDLQRMRVAPAFVAGRLSPEVVIGLVAAHIGHDVDARAAAQRPAHRERDGATVQARLRRRPEAPVALGAEIGRPHAGVLDVFDLIGPARLQQQHGRVGLLAEAAGDDRAARTGADDDIVVLRLQIGAPRRLILRDRLAMQRHRARRRGRDAERRAEPQEGAAPDPAMQQRFFGAVEAIPALDRG